MAFLLSKRAKTLHAASLNSKLCIPPNQNPRWKASILLSGAPRIPHNSLHKITTQSPYWGIIIIDLDVLSPVQLEETWSFSCHPTKVSTRALNSLSIHWPSEYSSNRWFSNVHWIWFHTSASTCLRTLYMTIFTCNSLTLDHCDVSKESVEPVLATHWEIQSPMPPNTPFWTLASPRTRC